MVSTAAVWLDTVEPYVILRSTSAKVGRVKMTDYAWTDWTAISATAPPATLELTARYLID